jgi:hypothetical protein
VVSSPLTSDTSNSAGCLSYRSFETGSKIINYVALSMDFNTSVREMTGYVLDGRCSRLVRGTEISFLVRCPDTPPVRWLRGSFLSRVRRPKDDPDTLTDDV